MWETHWVVGRLTLTFPKMVTLKNNISCFGICSLQYIHTPNREYISSPHTPILILFLEIFNFRITLIEKVTFSLINRIMTLEISDFLYFLYIKIKGG